MADLPLNFVALDFETANRHPNSACALGLVTVADGQLVDEVSFLIRPEPLVFESGNIRVHGITPEKVRSMPTWDQLWPTILPYLDSKIWVAHNAGFDMKVLGSSLRAHALPIPRGRFFCSWRLAKKVFPGLSSYSLGALAAHFDWELQHHDALSDARVCAFLCLEAFRKAEITNLAQFQALGLKLQTFSLDTIASQTASLQTLEVRFDTIGEDESLNSRTVVFSGDLVHFTRDDAEYRAWQSGARVVTRVDEGVDYLVVGQKHGGYPILTPKLQAALRLKQEGSSLKIIDEKCFRDLVNRSSWDMMVKVTE